MTECWLTAKFTYKDIIPQSYLESIPAGKWASHLDKTEISSLVVIENDTFIGTSSYCESRFTEFERYGEIVSIYFLPEYMGKGYGAKLLSAVMDELLHMGYQDIFLWVLEDNHSARKFYEKSGFILSGKYMDVNIGGKEVREIQYCFHCRNVSGTTESDKQVI